MASSPGPNGTFRALAESKANFDAADTNKDGSLSLNEALAYGRKRGVFKKEFQEADGDDDGYVTRAEAKAYYASKEGPLG